MDNILAIETIEWWKVVLISLGAIIVFILCYLAINRLRYYELLNKYNKKLNKKYGMFSRVYLEGIGSIRFSKKYNGKFRTLSHKSKKHLRVFLKEWVKLVPYYCTLKRVAEKSTYSRLRIGVKKVFTLTPDFIKDRRWEYNPNFSAHYNYRRLIKFMNRFRISRAVINICTSIWMEVYNNQNFVTLTNDFENGWFVSYMMKDKLFS